VAVLQLPQVELHGKTGGGSGGERLLGRFGISVVATAVRHKGESSAAAGVQAARAGISNAASKYRVFTPVA
jgi:hypothetical protein